MVWIIPYLWIITYNEGSGRLKTFVYFLLKFTSCFVSGLKWKPGYFLDGLICSFNFSIYQMTFPSFQRFYYYRDKADLSLKLLAGSISYLDSNILLALMLYIYSDVSSCSVPWLSFRLCNLSPQVLQSFGCGSAFLRFYWFNFHQ